MLRLVRAHAATAMHMRRPDEDTTCACMATGRSLTLVFLHSKHDDVQAQTSQDLRNLPQVEMSSFHGHGDACLLLQGSHTCSCHDFVYSSAGECSHHEDIMPVAKQLHRT